MRNGEWALHVKFCIEETGDSDINTWAKGMLQPNQSSWKDRMHEHAYANFQSVTVERYHIINSILEDSLTSSFIFFITCIYVYI